MNQAGPPVDGSLLYELVIQCGAPQCNNVSQTSEHLSLNEEKHTHSSRISTSVTTIAILSERSHPITKAFRK